LAFSRKLQVYTASLLILAAFSLALPAAAADRMQLSQTCEIAVARSALPEPLRGNTTVYGLVGDHYQKIVEGSGPFTCIIERNHPDAIIPQCMDSAGIDSVLPAIIDRSEMAVAGADFPAIEAANQVKMQAGAYRPAARAGISYMMSDFNYAYVGHAQRVLKLAPHVMYYAPNITNEEVGGSLRGMSENIGTPFILNEGPHGYMIVYVQHEANPNEVVEACHGQLGERPPSFDPFPKG